MNSSSSESIDFYRFDDEFIFLFFQRDRSFLIVRVIIRIISTVIDDDGSSQDTFESLQSYQDLKYLESYIGQERKKKIKILFLNAQVSLNNLIDYDNIEALMAEAINSLKNCRLER